MPYQSEPQGFAQRYTRDVPSMDCDNFRIDDDIRSTGCIAIGIYTDPINKISRVLIVQPLQGKGWMCFTLTLG